MRGSIPTTGDLALTDKVPVPKVDILVTEGQGHNHIQVIGTLRKRLTVPEGRKVKESTLEVPREALC